MTKGAFTNLYVDYMAAREPKIRALLENKIKQATNHDEILMKLYNTLWTDTYSPRIMFTVNRPYEIIKVNFHA